MGLSSENLDNGATLSYNILEPRPKPTTERRNDEVYDDAFYSCVNDEAYDGATQPNNGGMERPAEDCGRRPHLGGGIRGRRENVICVFATCCECCLSMSSLKRMGNQQSLTVISTLMFGVISLERSMV